MLLSLHTFVFFFNLSPADISELFVIFLLSIFKFGLGVFSAIVLELPVYYRIGANLLGGFLGVLFYTYFGAIIKKKYIQLRYKGKAPPKFTKFNRRLIVFKKRFGIFGISLLSPLFLTIPVGIALSLNLTNKKWKIILWMTVASVFWCFVFFGVSYYFGYNFKE